jgi:hypothetical protein
MPSALPGPPSLGWCCPLGAPAARALRLATASPSWCALPSPAMAFSGSHPQFMQVQPSTANDARIWRAMRNVTSLHY